MYQDKINVAHLIAGYIGTPKKKFSDQIREEQEETAMLSIKNNSDLSGYHFYCSNHFAKSLFSYLSPEKFLKSKTFEELEIGKGYIYGTDYSGLLVTFRADSVASNSYMVMYEDESYAGFGGVFIKAPGKSLGVVIEPLKNWLLKHVARGNFED